tara:strand:+ start:619 stop:828 length:210 start_codon:yes stop_codon:yes gene_type:complete
MQGYNPKTKEYNAFAMMFGWGMSSVSKESINKQYEKKKVYKYIDKRTKKYGAQRVELLKNGKTNSRIKI